MKTKRERKSRIATTGSKNNNIIDKIATEKQPLYFSPRDLIGSHEHLLREILIHVPDKPICRFKLVSKLWLSIISDPDFSRNWHTKHVPSPSALLFCTTYRCRYKFISLDEREKNSFSPDFYFNFNFLPFSDHAHSSTKILQSCNGLLLLMVKDGFGVHNPSTNQSKLTPKLPEKYSKLSGLCTRLVFDPSKSPHYKVFSFFSLRDYYKLLSIEILIYASETDFWKVLSIDEDSLFNTITFYDGVMFEAGVLWNGAIHWPRQRESSSFYFDIDKECCMKMPMPPIQGGQQVRTIKYFGETGGHLHLIDYKGDYALQFDVFRMELDYSNWFVKYRVDLIPLCWRIDAVDWRIQKFTFLTLIVNGDGVEGEEESPVLVMHLPKTEMLISYNLNNEVLKNICPSSLQSWDLNFSKQKNWSTIHQFIRSPVRF